MSANDTPIVGVKEPVWQGEELTPEVANGMDDVMARIYGLLAWHAATRTRVTLTTLGQVEDMDNEPIGAAEAWLVVTELHQLGLVRVADFRNATAHTPMAVRLSRTSAPMHLPRHLRFAPDRVKVGGRFTAPKDLEPKLLTALLSTARRISKHNTVPGNQRDGRWVTTLAELTERRAEAFRHWSTIDAARVVYDEGKRLTQAAVLIREQAANRLAEEERQAADGNRR